MKLALPTILGFAAVQSEEDEVAPQAKRPEEAPEEETEALAFLKSFSQIMTHEVLTLFLLIRQRHINTSMLNPITDASSDSPLSKNEISFSREARRKFLTFCAEGAEKLFLRALLFLVQEAIATHGVTDFGRRMEQRWP